MKALGFKNEVTASQNKRTTDSRRVVLWTISFLAIAALLLLLAGCAPKRQPVPTFWGNTPAQAKLAAGLHALEVNGVFYVVAPTGSMRPTLEAGDYVVVKSIKYEELIPGMMVNYQARWLRPDRPTVVHWNVRKFGDDWVMDGENNRDYENKKENMMGRKEFRGIVVGIYTTRQAP